MEQQKKDNAGREKSFSESSETEAKSLINKELDIKFKYYKKIILAFLAGFCIFIGAGLTWKDVLLRPIIENIYSAPYIYQKIKVELAKDESFRDIIIDEEKSAGAILKILGKNVDSGYSRSIIFSKETTREKNFILFYALKNQEVELTILAQSDNQSASFSVTIDNQPWGKERKFPFVMVQGNITKYLRFDEAPGANLHTIRFIPKNLSENDRANIDCVILVENAKGS
jgi:hypothetical protein